MKEFDAMMGQFQRVAEHSETLLWTSWGVAIFHVVGFTAVAIYLAIHLAGLIKAAIRFLDAKSADLEIETALTSDRRQWKGAGSSATAPLESNADSKYRPKG
jgi:hypothetical protein